jgi:cell wall-associated NlpC family hydrolase
MPTSLATALRRLVLALAAVAIVAVTPDTASATKPRGKKPAATASRTKHKSAASSRRAKASHSSRGAKSSSRRKGRRSHHVYTGPIVPDVEQIAFVSDSADRLRDSIVSVARQQIGTPYVWGAENPGRAFDCSGLVKYVMSWLHVDLPRTANEQAYSGIKVGRDLDRMKPGDLLTFGTGRRITHIAIYAGNGKYVHASRPGVGVVESPLDTRAARFKGAIRLVADADTTTTKSAPTP